MDIFDRLNMINNYLVSNNEAQARNELIKLLNEREKIEPQYLQLLNHFIRKTGLYPYLDVLKCSWEDRYVNLLFQSDCGYDSPIILHREQSYLLKQLLEGENIVVSAPTSFGKSFIIDSFIAIKQPKMVVIIVPTIALTDETRRRLFRKFSDKYKIITTSEASLSENNILIFPQERALHYVGILKDIDILIIDEFYKISSNFGDDRATSLYKAIQELSHVAKQRYFLAPNIKSINENLITKNMIFIDKLDFNTVVLEEYNLAQKKLSDQEKEGVLLNILNENIKTQKKSKNLIYAGTYSEIDKVSFFLVDKLQSLNSQLLNDFSLWLKSNYSSGWDLPLLIERGIGIHNGKMHRSLSQIQLKLFEEEIGLNTIISTSSIIEGINTSAENVIIWKNKIGRYKLNDFTYKNIIGRGGRMFKYFIGKVFLLDETPSAQNNELEIQFPEELLGSYDATDVPTGLSTDQTIKNDTIRNTLIQKIGIENYKKVFKGNLLQLVDNNVALKIIDSLKNDDDWNGFSYFLSDEPQKWDRLLWKIINIRPEWWESAHSTLVEFVKILSLNWNMTIPELLDEVDYFGVSINDFFKLERVVSYKLSSLLNDVNVLYSICRKDNVDISPFIYKVSSAFMPKVVFQLEEFGLPRMISKKIHDMHIINLEDNVQDIYVVILKFKTIGLENMIKKLNLTMIEEYILRYFYEGITLNKKNPLKIKEMTIQPLELADGVEFEDNTNVPEAH